MDIDPLKDDFDVFRGGDTHGGRSGFKPRSGLPTRSLELPLDWDMDPFGDRNWCFQLHAWRMLNPFWARLYGKDWERLKHEVVPWMRDWHRYHVTEGKTSRFAWYDMSAGLRAHHLALVLFLYKSGEMDLADEERADIESLARLHIAALMDESFISRGNHGLFQLTGLRLLGAVWSGRPEVAAESAYSNRLMTELVESQFSHQGVHVENSPSYHNFAIRHFSRIRPGLFYQAEASLSERLRRAKSVAPWFTLPDGTIAAIGDSEGTGIPFFPETSAVTPSSATRSGDDVFMRDLTESGYAVIRTGPEAPRHRQEMLILKAQAFTTSHGHSDHLGFELYAGGVPLLVDSGRFSYDVDRWRSYFKSDRAHNVVGITGRAFSPYETDLLNTGLSRVEALGGAYEVKGEVRKCDGFAHRRTFTYKPGESLVVSDTVDLAPGDTPVAFYHLGPDIDVEIVGAEILLRSAGRHLATLTYPPSVLTPHLVRGQVVPYIQGWVSPRYGVRVPATVIEFVGAPGLCSWEIAVALHESTRPTELLQRTLPGGIVVPFHYSRRSDNVLFVAAGQFERRVLLEYYHGSVDGVAKLLAKEFEAAGYILCDRRDGVGSARLFYKHQNGEAANFFVRAKAAFAVKTVAAIGSVYMAFRTRSSSAKFAVGSVSSPGK